MRWQHKLAIVDRSNDVVSEPTGFDAVFQLSLAKLLIANPKTAVFMLWLQQSELCFHL